MNGISVSVRGLCSRMLVPLAIVWVIIPASNAGTLQAECDALELLRNTPAHDHLLEAIERCDNIGDHTSPAVQGEPEPATQARFLSLCAYLCSDKARDRKLSPEQKHYYFTKEFNRWVDYFEWFKELEPDKKKAWIGKKIIWKHLTTTQEGIVVAGKYLGEAACSAIWDSQDPRPDGVLTDGLVAVRAYERIDEIWLNEQAIDNWGKLFTPPNEVLEARRDQIQKIVNDDTWRQHWINLGKTAQRRGDADVFADQIRAKFKAIAARIKKETEKVGQREVAASHSP